NVSEQHPACAAAEGVAHCPELRAPAIERAEVAREDLRQVLRRLPVAAHAREIKLVQQRRVESSQFLTLEAIQNMSGRAREVGRVELLGDGVEAPQRAAVVVLVVALDQLHRQVREGPRPALDRFERITHVILQANATSDVAVPESSTRQWRYCGFGKAPVARNAYRI